MEIGLFRMLVTGLILRAFFKLPPVSQNICSQTFSLTPRSLPTLAQLLIFHCAPQIPQSEGNLSQRAGSFSNGLQATANIATIIAACLLSVVLVKNYLLSGPALRPPVRTPTIPTVSVGNNLKSQLSDVNWSANGETVLLALSTHCHFCSESAPCFRQLSQKSGNTFKIVAVLPESVTASQDYLEREGVHVDQLRQMPLDRVGIVGTPTMLLLDRSGTVTKFWIGKLKPEEQSAALKAIGAET